MLGCNRYFSSFAVALGNTRRSKVAEIANFDVSGLIYEKVFDDSVVRIGKKHSSKLQK
jgi:hypothetical protein